MLSTFGLVNRSSKYTARRPPVSPYNTLTHLPLSRLVQRLSSFHTPTTLETVTFVSWPLQVTRSLRCRSSIYIPVLNGYYQVFGTNTNHTPSGIFILNNEKDANEVDQQVLIQHCTISTARILTCKYIKERGCSCDKVLRKRSRKCN
jgi:hypothetical protein